MKRRALIVAINKYLNDTYIRPLRYAHADAWRVNNFLYNHGFEIWHLIESEATVGAVEHSLDEIVDGLSEGDVFLLYFSGHGCERSEEQCLLLYDTDINMLPHGGGSVVTMRSVEKCTRIPGVARALVLDCCRSPIYFDKGASLMDHHYSSRDIHSIVESDAPKISPLAIVCSCHPGMQAFEDKTLGCGVFTYAMLDVFDDCHNRGEAVGFYGDIPHRIAYRARQLVKENRLPEEMAQAPYIEGSADGVVLVPGGGHRKRKKRQQRPRQPHSPRILFHTEFEDSVSVEEGNAEIVNRLGRNGSRALRSNGDSTIGLTKTAIDFTGVRACRIFIALKTKVRGFVALHGCYLANVPSNQSRPGAFMGRIEVTESPEWQEVTIDIPNLQPYKQTGEPQAEVYVLIETKDTEFLVDTVQIFEV